MMIEKWIGYDMETVFFLHVFITYFLIHNTDYVDKLLLSHVNSNHMQIKRKKTQIPCLLSTCIAWMQFFLMSRIMRKPAFEYAITKVQISHAVTVKLISTFVFAIEYTIPLLSKSVISSLLPPSVSVQPGLCRTWLETPKTGFLHRRLI